MDSVITLVLIVSPCPSPLQKGHNSWTVLRLSYYHMARSCKRESSCQLIDLIFWIPVTLERRRKEPDSTIITIRRRTIAIAIMTEESIWCKNELNYLKQIIKKKNFFLHSFKSLVLPASRSSFKWIVQKERPKREQTIYLHWSAIRKWKSNNN